MKEKLILAYSGGLDTSVILKWLIEKGYEVICFLADVGQKEDLVKIKEKALLIGASRVYIEDLRKEFLEQYVFQALKVNAKYEGRYLLGTSLARPLIAKKQIEIAKKENTLLLGHGATGKGNDQVRFELTYLTLMPDVNIISPWKDPTFLSQFQGRNDMIAYAKMHGIPVTSTKEKPYSMDENLMHVSYEGGILENPNSPPPDTMFHYTNSPKTAPDREIEIAIEFQNGIPVVLSDLTYGQTISHDPVNLFVRLNELAGEAGIGRVDIVENRFVGMKLRGVYDAPAATVLWKAHHDLEALVLDREVLHLKELWAPAISKLIYNGFWFSPEMEFYMAAIEKSQERVSGTVVLTLYKGNAIITRRSSPHSLYHQELVSMDCLGDYNQCDATGFIKLNALRLRRSSL